MNKRCKIHNRISVSIGILSIEHNKMKSTFIRTLSLLLLLQFAVALPFVKREAGGVAVAHKHAVVDKKTTSSVESSDEDLDARTRLLAITLVGLTGVFKFTLDEGVTVFQGALKQLNALPDKSEELQANITRMEKFLKTYKLVELTEDIDSLANVFDSMEEFADILVDYDDMPDSSKTKQQLKQAFDENGYERFEKQFEEHVEKFAKAFNEEFEKYLHSGEEKDAKLVAWYNKFKGEKDRLKKVDIFGEFFDRISK